MRATIAAILLFFISISFVNSGLLGRPLKGSLDDNVVPFESFEEILRKSMNFLYNDDLRGLFDYLAKIPNWKELVDWLAEHYPEAYKAIQCLMFGNCENGGVVIDPIQIQNILRYIALSDWDGLSAYVCSQPNLEIVVMWIKINYPNAFAAIEGKIKDC